MKRAALALLVLALPALALAQDQIGAFRNHQAWCWAADTNMGRIGACRPTPAACARDARAGQTTCRQHWPIYCVMAEDASVQCMPTAPICETVKHVAKAAGHPMSGECMELQ